MTFAKSPGSWLSPIIIGHPTSSVEKCFADGSASAGISAWHDRQRPATGHNGPWSVKCFNAL